MSVFSWACHFGFPHRVRTRMEEATQKMMDKGSAMMYRTRPVKFSKRKKFPINPHASEIAFRTISLGSRSVSIVTHALPHIATVTHHFGSAIPTPLSSVPSGKCPLLARITRHGLTSAAMERTLHSGPIVAAMRGIAVDANHHFLIRLSGTRLGTSRFFFLFFFLFLFYLLREIVGFCSQLQRSDGFDGIFSFQGGTFS